MRSLALVLLLVAALPAAAQEPIMTRLTLAETATIEVADDRYMAVLEGHAEAADAAAAQAALNRQMQQALDAVAGLDALIATTQGYHVRERQIDDAPNRWIATQALRLETADRVLLLDRAAALQAMGLATRQLGSLLSTEAHDAQRDGLLTQALAAIARRAETVAEQLGLRVVGYAEINVDGFHPGPVPRAMAMDAAAAAPPVMTESRSTVAVTVNATVLLAR